MVFCRLKNMKALMPHASETQFLKWSSGIRAENYDVRATLEILNCLPRRDLKGLDIGGGMGAFALAVVDALERCHITIVDRSVLAAENFVGNKRVSFCFGDFLEFSAEEKFDFILFKTVLHHLISSNDSRTRDLQLRALTKAKDLLKEDGVIIVEENFYEGIGGSDITGRVIFELTKLKSFERLFRILGANTAGEGVRFRCNASWNEIFKAVGLRENWRFRSSSWGRQWPIWQKIPLFGKERFQALVGLVPIKA